MKNTWSASCSMAPESLKSESAGLWLVLCSTLRDNWQRHKIGTSNSLANCFKLLEYSAISCCLSPL